MFNVSYCRFHSNNTHYNQRLFIVFATTVICLTIGNLFAWPYGIVSYCKDPATIMNILHSIGFFLTIGHCCKIVFYNVVLNLSSKTNQQCQVVLTGFIPRKHVTNQVMCFDNKRDTLSYSHELRSSVITKVDFASTHDLLYVALHRMSLPSSKLITYADTIISTVDGSIMLFYLSNTISVNTKVVNKETNEETNHYLLIK